MTCKVNLVDVRSYLDFDHTFVVCSCKCVASGMEKNVHVGLVQSHMIILHTLQENSLVIMVSTLQDLDRTASPLISTSSESCPNLNYSTSFIYIDYTSFFFLW